MTGPARRRDAACTEAAAEYLPDFLHLKTKPMGTYAPVQATKYCHACARILDARAVRCTGCGVLQPPPPDITEKRILPALLLCFFLGVFGAHRFYVGKTATAVLQLVTLGGLGIWTLIDFITIIVGAFSDSEGNKITEWT
jgi:TM2 domain-containing membrane protein YozV